MKRFSELKVGDKITARYYENVVVRLKKPDEAGRGRRSRRRSLVAQGTARRDGRGAADHHGDRDGEGSEDIVASRSPGPNGYKYSRKVADKKAFEQAEGRRPARHDLDRCAADLGRAAEEVDRVAIRLAGMCV